MADLHVAQIARVSLRGTAADTLSHSAYTRTQEWLGQWSPERVFKAVIAENRAAAIEGCRIDLQRELVPPFLRSLGVRPEHFLFRISDQKAINGRFWVSSAIVCGTDFEVVPLDGEQS